MLAGFYIFFLILLMMALFAFAFKLFGRLTRKPAKTKAKRSGKAGDPGACPICGIALERGQKIKSAVFPGGNDRICHIFGCPSCLSPSPPLESRRTCPVCKSELTQEEYLVARLFEHPGRKSHVHILGCVHCRFG